MVTERLDVRLDPERRRKLEELAEHRQASVSDTVRELIDQAYEDEAREHRLKLVREIAGLNIEDVPDPEELSRQLAQTHDLGDLY
ncbi:MAG TPA: hypothetical protein VFS30_09060 [Dehalococcoidia bacterium]|nr:hypothetical protein [Dehalococcoidia bacterium]